MAPAPAAPHFPMRRAVAAANHLLHRAGQEPDPTAPHPAERGSDPTAPHPAERGPDPTADLHPVGPDPTADPPEPDPTADPPEPDPTAARPAGLDPTDPHPVEQGLDPTAAQAVPGSDPTAAQAAPGLQAAEQAPGSRLPKDRPAARRTARGPRGSVGPPAAPHLASAACSASSHPRPTTAPVRGPAGPGTTPVTGFRWPWSEPFARLRSD